MHVLCRNKRQTLPFAGISQAEAFTPSVNSDAPSTSQMGLMQLRGHGLPKSTQGLVIKLQMQWGAPIASWGQEVCPGMFCSFSPGTDVA